MSNKTIFKRIALVAITALGAGILSVTPVNASGAFVADRLDVDAVTSSVNVGACSVTADPVGQGGTFVTGSVVQMTWAASDSVYITLAGPAIFEGGAAITTTPAAGTSVTTTPQTYLTTNGLTNRVITFRLTGTGAVTVTASTTATAAAVDSFTVNSVASCATSTYSAAKSNFTIEGIFMTDADGAGGTAWATAFNNVDSADQEIVTVGGTGYARAALNNEYGDNLSSKPVVASTNTPNCWVDVKETTNTEGSGTSPAASTAVLTSTGADLVLAVKAAVTGTAVDCTVNLTWNGISVGSKTFKLLGVPASVTVSDVTVGEVSGNGYYRVTVRDSLSRLLPSVSIDNDNTQTNNAAALTVVSDASSNSTSTGASSDASTGAKYGVTPAVTSDRIQDGTVAEYACTSKGGAAKITVRALQSGVTYVTSAPFDVYCGGTTLDTWSMSLDKATYAPGEIATLTITGKDSDGLLMHSLEALGALTQSFGGLTFVTTPTSADLFNSAAGAKTYQLSVGTSEGSFVGTFALTTAATDSKAKTIQYTVKSSTATVTNADVLKSIVSLIASINKQIQALQKLILRR